MSMPIQLPFAEYRFSFTALERITLPSDSGTVWHAVLGKALRELSCLIPAGQCEHCFLANQCDYPALFQGRKPPKSEIMTRASRIPAPHIIRSLHRHAYQVNAQQSFQVDIILLAKLNQKLTRLIRAMQRIGSNGFGSRRQKAVLTQVIQKQALSGMDHMILMDGNAIQSRQPIQYAIPTLIPQRISLQMHTPYRATGKAQKAKTFLVDKFIMALIRRIGLLQYFTTGKKLQVDYMALKQLAKTLVVTKNTLYQYYDANVAQRNNQHKQGKGWLGNLEIDLSQHQALWPYLYLGQWLHVGKNASMGFGRYQLIILA